MGAEPVTRFGRVFQRKGRKGWYIRVRRVGMADLVKMAGPSEGHATRYLARLEVLWYDAKAAGRPLAPPRVTLQAFAKDYLRQAKARMTQAAHENAVHHLAVAAERLPGPLAGITGAHVSELLTWLRVKRDAKPGTANRYLSTLSGCFRAAKERGFCTENPCLGVRRLRVQETPTPYLSDADCLALEARAPRDLRPLLVLASETGARLGELEALQRRDLDLRRAMLTVRQSKSGRVRHVPMTRRALEAARSVPLGPVKMRGENPVFPALRGRRRWLARQFPKWAEAAGLQRVTFHGLRHAWASRLTAAGVDPLVLMRLGGWASLAMVQRYAHHRPADAGRQAMELVERLRATGTRGTRRGTKARKRA